MTGSRAAVWRAFAVSVLLAAVALLFCSKSSPLYPINDWSDANIYFSVGKGMLRGEVVYRDLYDHKGPLLYALHALCALASPMSFTGVYVLEVLCAAAFLTIADRLLRLYGVARFRAALGALLAMLVYASVSFQQGDSAEELCLPLLLWSLYELLRHLKTDGDKPMPFARVMLNGALFGCVFWIKFTLCGLHAAFLLALLWEALARKSGARFGRYLGAYALGFAVSTLPWLVYFGLNGAIGDWLKTYLYDNLFLYAEGEEAFGLLPRAKAMAASALLWAKQNPCCVALIALGLLWGLCRKKAAKLERLTLALAAALMATGVFIGGKSYPYYGLALAALMPMGLVPLGRLLGCVPAMRSKHAETAVSVALCALCLAGSYLISPNPPTSMLVPREQTMQYQLAAVIDRYENPTLLNYGFMDAGFFTASGVTPSVKYFHQTNVPLQEMLDEQVRYIDEGICDFVVTRGKQPDSILRHYELVATADSPGFWYERVYLYRRLGLRQSPPSAAE